MKRKLNVLKLLTLSLMIIGLSSCAFLERRDFESEMSEFRMDDPMFTPNQDFAVVPGDEGRYYRSDSVINSRTPATAKTQENRLYNSSLARELRSLESRMDETEYNEYLKYRTKLGNDSEKIYYLHLSERDRGEYLQSRKIETPQFYTVNETNMAALSREIVLGMPKTDVLRSWGQPIQRDYAGDPRYQNERWAYRRNGALSYVYFNGGVVEGWQDQ